MQGTCDVALSTLLRNVTQMTDCSTEHFHQTTQLTVIYREVKCKEASPEFLANRRRPYHGAASIPYL